MEYIGSLLSLVRLNLPPNAGFSTFFHENIVSPFLLSLPSVVHDISDSFDISLPVDKNAPKSRDSSLKQNSNPSSSNSKLTRQNSRLRSFSFLTSPPEKDHYVNTESKKRINSKIPIQPRVNFASNTSPSTLSRSSFQSNSQMKISDQSIFKIGTLNRKNTSRNPLLADGRRKFIGSHFNTKLSNISSLFRESKLIRHVPGKKAVSGQPKKNHSGIKNVSSSLKRGQHVSNPSNTSLITGNNKLVRAAKNGQHLNCNIMSPQKNAINNQNVVRETPTRKQSKCKSPSMVPISYQSPPANHQSVAILVAEAAFAARKQKSKNSEK